MNVHKQVWLLICLVFSVIITLAACSRFQDGTSSFTDKPFATQRCSSTTTVTSITKPSIKEEPGSVREVPLATILSPTIDPLLVDSPVVNIVRQDLADQLEISIQSIRVLAVLPAIWADSCLGAASPKEMCADVITPGYQVLLEVEGRTFEYHTDETGLHYRLFQGIDSLVPGIIIPDLSKPTSVEPGGIKE